MKIKIFNEILYIHEWVLPMAIERFFSKYEDTLTMACRKVNKKKS